ncbi:MAG: hypothetical protein SP4CHLAM5_07420 [Chlamydiia bacterium]|nr:hypothetical protein [Chlamydiia bacterium]MCH9618609.1 hypothetical protein [Chlamydiia bacterium]MCH9624329.1 hypothetical protein [Chlamydiia bacterium]
MQVKIEKYLFAGTKNNHDRFFEKAQALGMMEFISVTGKKPHLFPEDVQKAKDALKILSIHAKGKQENDAPVPILDIISEVVSTKEKLEILYEKKRSLKVERIRVKPFGSFSMEEIHAIEEEGRRHIQFFMIKHDRIPTSKVPGELVYIGHELDIDYYIYIGKEKFSHKAFTQVHIERSIDAVNEEMDSTAKEISSLQRLELENCRYIHLMQEYVFARMNSINLNFAKEDVDYFIEDKLFVIEAWIPLTKKKKLEELLDGLAIISEKVAIEKDDQPPTYLKNSGFSRMGEDLVYVYDTPAIDDKDPSAWVLWFFALFFGMIVSDAGYGFLFLALALFLWKKSGKGLKGAKRRMLKILTLISCSTIIWGVMVASYFSIQLKPNDFLNKISLPYNLALEKVEFHRKAGTDMYKDWVKDYPAIEDVDVPAEILSKGTKVKAGNLVYDLMGDIYDSIFLEISLIIGIIHLTLSFLRNMYRSWSGIGWIFTLFGGYLFFPKMLQGYSMLVYTGVISADLSFVIGEQMLYGGFSLAILLSIIQARSLSGIASLFKAIEVFSDVLSYLRLYALGLASMVLAGTFNEIGPAIGGPMFGWLIILLGHIVNITLGVMAGVIHGLRLNFLEWYHHCYEGGGKKFSPLRLLKSE